MKKKYLLILISQLIILPVIAQTFHTISRDELHDIIAGYWIGQLVGNYLGFPFEGTYTEEAVPVFVDRYYDFRDDSTLVINRNDLRGYCPVTINWMEGAFSDDDTDIEFVTLHALEKFGLDITYPEIADMWQKHINRKIWCANRTARDLMNKGFIPPATGSKTNNPNWYQIDPQLVNEIWSVVYPGMIRKSAERAEWGARITSDDWGTHPTIAYAVMYSGAIFQKDVQKLIELALKFLPEESPFKEGIRDIIAWHRQQPDWRVARKLIFDKYYHYKKGAFIAPVSDVTALTNGLFGIMAIIYGNGDFVQTTGIAVSAGLDCDNQAATCGGLIGVLNGAKAIPDRLTLGMSGKPVWKLPFNDTYINITRDSLPGINRISDITERLLNLAELAIIENGGSKFQDGRKVFYRIKTDL